MKKLLAIQFFLVAIVVSCALTDSRPMATVTLNFSSPAARSIGPTTLPSIERFEAHWESGELVHEMDNLQPTAKVSVEAGTWSVTVKGFDSALGGQVVAEAIKTVTVVEGDNIVAFALIPVTTSSGQVDIDFDWAESSDHLIFELSPWSTPDISSPAPPPTATFTMNGTGALSGSIADYPATEPFLTAGSYTYEGTARRASFVANLKSGNYLLKLSVMNSTQLMGLYSQIVQVVDGGISSKRFNPVRGIFYDANGGAGSMAPQKDLIGQSQTILANAFTYAYFNGWNSKANGTGTSYASGQTVTIGSEDLVLYAQWITTKTLDFEALTIADVHGQDGWEGGDFNPLAVVVAQADGSTAAPMNSSIAPNTSKVLAHYNMGGSQYASASRNTGLTLDLTDPKKTYTLTFDMVYTWWGTEFGFGADLNSSGTIPYASNGEHALTIRAVGSPNPQSVTLRLPDGSTQTLGSSPVGVSNDAKWIRFELTLNLDKVSVRAMNLTDSGSWLTLWNNQSMGTVTGSGQLTDPETWKRFYLGHESGGGRLDNITLAVAIAP